MIIKEAQRDQHNLGGRGGTTNHSFALEVARSQVLQWAHCSNIQLSPAFQELIGPCNLYNTNGGQTCPGWHGSLWPLVPSVPVGNLPILLRLVSCAAFPSLYARGPMQCTLSPDYHLPKVTMSSSTLLSQIVFLSQFTPYLCLCYHQHQRPLTTWSSMCSSHMEFLRISSKTEDHNSSLLFGENFANLWTCGWSNGVGQRKSGDHTLLCHCSTFPGLRMNTTLSHARPWVFLRSWLPTPLISYSIQGVKAEPFILFYQYYSTQSSLFITWISKAYFAAFLLPW